ncbi:MAG: arginine repressor [Clostridia bacterium]|nr:arginine repressor [Clostridia bacterium]
MKNKRQEMILEIIKNNIVLTQEDIQNALIKAGFSVTQSTVSRDIKELKLIKGHDSEGNYRYISAAKGSGSSKSLTHYYEMFKTAAKSVDCALNDIVIRCHNGMASGACVAVDAIFGDRMLGTIAGDDTIFIVMRSVEDAVALTKELEKMI